MLVQPSMRRCAGDCYLFALTGGSFLVHAMLLCIPAPLHDTPALLGRALSCDE
jgi:hypothetical protein